MMGLITVRNIEGVPQQNIITAGLRKESAHSVVTCRLIKNR